MTRRRRRGLRRRSVVVPVERPRRILRIECRACERLHLFFNTLPLSHPVTRPALPLSHFLFLSQGRTNPSGLIEEREDARNTCVYVYMRVYDVRTTCVYAYALFFESLAGLLFSFLDVLGQQESTPPSLLPFPHPLTPPRIKSKCRRLNLTLNPDHVSFTGILTYGARCKLYY